MGKTFYQGNHYAVQYSVQRDIYFIVDEQTKSYITDYREKENAIEACKAFEEAAKKRQVDFVRSTHPRVER